MSYYDDLNKNDIDEFFEKHGDTTAAETDLGYGCSSEVTVEELYHMFKARMLMEAAEEASNE